MIEPNYDFKPLGFLIEYKKRPCSKYKKVYKESFEELRGPKAINFSGKKAGIL